MENSSPGRNRRVKRCLFGKPDQQEVEKWLDETSKKQLKRSKDKWSYDFELDVPVKGDIEYEPVPIEQVPSIYKPRKVGKRRRREVTEFNPNIPSASSGEGTSEEGSEQSHRPFTRSCTKQNDDNSVQNRRSLKQAKLTNYLRVRKRRSADSRGSKDAVTPIKNMKSAAPSSPFRFVEPHAESEGVMDNESSPRSSSTSPPKSPRKRAAPRAVHPLHTNIFCGVLTPLSKWKEQHSSWTDWSICQLSKTSEWLFGSSRTENSVRYIHLPTVKIQADLLMDLYSREFLSEVDGTGSIVAYSTFYDSAGNIVHTKENFDVVLAYLSERGDLVIGQDRHGEQILKFRDTTSKGPVRFTEADASVHDIRRAMSKVEKEINTLEKKIQKLDLDCRTALRTGDKTKAASLLRQKKRAQKDVTDKDGQYQRLLTMLEQLGSTKHHKDVLDAYKAGTEAFKATLARHGLSPDKIDHTLDDVASSIDEFREIEEAISLPVLPKAYDEDELEKELEDLVAKQMPLPTPPNVTPKKKAATSLPDVPSNTVGYREDDDKEAMDLEKRLERLRSAM